jgi:CTP synthase (UTP-ammonia lyase)
VVGLTKAGHTENNPQAKVPLLVLASCPVDNRPAGAPRLSGRLHIKVLSGSRAYDIYDRNEIDEAFSCNYELNPAYRDVMQRGGIRVSGVSADGGVRIIELPGHPFFLATGFLPQLSSTESKPHPLLVAYLRAAMRFRAGHGK